jgi:hypothetical protein
VKIEYIIKTDNDMLTVKLRTADVHESVCVVNSITNKQIKACGNLIDRKTLPIRFCEVMLKEFQFKVVQMILRSSDYVLFDDLRNSIIEYTKGINQSKIEIITVDQFKELTSKVQEYMDNVQ